MRKRERPSLNETQQTLLRPSQESDRILTALGTMSTRLGKPLSEERIKQWMDDTNNYPVEAIEWALDSWARNAKVLPTLADLLQLLRTWYTQAAPEKCECAHLHGTGYGWKDLKWLLKKRGEFAERFSMSQWEDLFAQLDKSREGGAPEWRKTAGDFLR